LKRVWQVSLAVKFKTASFTFLILILFLILLILCFHREIAEKTKQATRQTSNRELRRVKAHSAGLRRIVGELHFVFDS
jgi:cytochrome c biogenesis protein ResB